MNSRRDFCKKTVLITSVCSLGGSFLLNSCGTSNRALATDYSFLQNILKVKLSAFAEKSYLVFDDNKLETPVYIKKSKDDNYQAFLMKCTHRGCTVRASGPIMICPCHGAEFNGKGEVLSGPAQKPLKKFNVLKTDTELEIKLI